MLTFFFRSNRGTVSLGKLFWLNKIVNLEYEYNVRQVHVRRNRLFLSVQIIVSSYGKMCHDTLTHLSQSFWP